MAIIEGNNKVLSQLTLTPATIMRSCTKVATQDIRAAPAFSFAAARP